MKNLIEITTNNTYSDKKVHLAHVLDNDIIVAIENKIIKGIFTFEKETLYALTMKDYISFFELNTDNRELINSQLHKKCKFYILIIP